MTLDTVIIGAGPAGISAAIYLKRAGRDIVLLERKEVGGLLHNAHLVENYPGFDGVKGNELAGHMKGQLHKWGIVPEHRSATLILWKEGHFRVETPEGELLARTVIVASGTFPKRLDIPGAEELEGVRLFYEVKEIPEPASGRKFIIIGSGDAAFDYALNLSSQGAEVDIIFRGSQPKCLPLLLGRVEADPSIRIHPDIHPSVLEDHGDRIVAKCSHVDMEADFILGAIGREPDNSLLADLKDGRPGLFIAGDVRQGKCRQVGIAVGDGIKAAVDAMDHLADIGKASGHTED